MESKDISKKIEEIKESIQVFPKPKSQPKKKQEEEDNSIITSAYVDMNDHLIAEQVYDGHTSQFAIYDYKTGEVSYAPNFESHGSLYKPIFAEEVSKGAVLLPEKAEDYGSDEQIDSEINAFIIKWLDVPNDFRQFALWNIKRSWVFDRFHTLNYTRFLGDTGQGKTRGLDVIGGLHYKPVMTSGATTSSPVFRIIEKWRPTMIFDEGDFKKTDETEAIVKIINLGYEKGKYIMRCDQNDANIINFFDPFCPKVIATRKSFEDKAVESRCITVQMVGTKRKDIPLNLNDDFKAEQLRLRNKLLMWRFRNFFDIDPNFRPETDFSKLEPRLQQTVSSYLALFGKDQNQMDNFKTFMENYQAELIDERQSSWEGQIVVALHDLLEKGERNISAQDIIDEAGLTNENNKPVKPRGLTSTLRELGFGKAVVTRIEEKTKRCLPLEQEHLDSLFARYGVTIVTIVTGSGANLLGYMEGQKMGESGALRNDRNNSNNVTQFDPKILAWQPCEFPAEPDKMCQETPCNEFDGHYYCAKHFKEVQV